MRLSLDALPRAAFLPTTSHSDAAPMRGAAKFNQFVLPVIHSQVQGPLRSRRE